MNSIEELKQEEQVLRLVTNEKSRKILTHLAKNRMSNKAIASSDLKNEIDATYSHTINRVTELNRNGLVRFTDKVGRKKPVELTSDGVILAEAVMKLENTVKEVLN